ncbi:MAG: hypothetical protein GX846_01195 [Deltaproteobacteria bacterium]|nr:hypothetical protein [Deltaproteobacteria bacterium]
MNLEGDIVLVYFKDDPGVYARIERIEPDIKKGWYQVTLMLLTIPYQVITWILREEYINGQGFTMGGNSMRLEKIERLSLEENNQDNAPEKSRRDKKPV